MSQIQNSTLHNYVQPAVLIAAAFAASSSRFIEYFPGASPGGLRIRGVVGATFALASQKWVVEEESPSQSLLRATTSFAAGGLASLATTKGLKGRVELSPSAALQLTAVQFVYGVVIAISSAYTTEKTEPLPPPPPP